MLQGHDCVILLAPHESLCALTRYQAKPRIQIGGSHTIYSQIAIIMADSKHVVGGSSSFGIHDKQEVMDYGEDENSSGMCNRLICFLESMYIF